MLIPTEQVLVINLTGLLDQKQFIFQEYLKMIINGIILESNDILF